MGKDRKFGAGTEDDDENKDDYEWVNSFFLTNCLSRRCGFGY